MLNKLKNKMFQQPKSVDVFAKSFVLYTISSMSLALSCRTITLWMYDAGVSSAANMALSALLHLPYSFRIAFVPWLEFIKIPLIKNWGYRKSLIIYMHLISIACILGMAIMGMSNFKMLILLGFICSIASTSAENLSTTYLNYSYNQDVRPNWVQGGQFGYHFASWVVGTLYIYLCQFISWPKLYIISALFLIVNLCIITRTNNCAFERISQPSFTKAYITPVKNLLNTHKNYFHLLIWFFIFFRAADRLLVTLLPLLLIEVFGKTGAAALKTLALLCVFIGSFVWTFFKRDNVMQTLVSISVVHMAHILVVACVLCFYYKGVYVNACLVILSITIFSLKIIRISESCASYAFQYFLLDQKYFNAQSSAVTLTDRFMGDILKSVSGVMYVFMGWPIFLATSILFVIPSWFIAIKLSKYFTGKKM